MDIWWCAIDKTWSSYEELKDRGVVAQGWPALGDLRTLLRFVPHNQQSFRLTVQRLGDVAYADLDLWRNQDRNLTRAPTVFWNLASLRKGDLVVGLEGTVVRGVCQLTRDARISYSLDRRFHYAQTVGPVEWIDWEMGRFGFVPTAPAQCVHGIKHLTRQRPAVASAWAANGKPCALIPGCWINIDFPTRTCLLHSESCEYVTQKAPTLLKGVYELRRDGGWLEFGDRDSAEDFARRLVAARGRHDMKACGSCSS